jgi:hypothetical protein
MQNPDEMMALAVTAFQHWRTSRAHRVVKTPPALQQQAAALRTSFSSSKIMKALSVSGTNLKRWSNQKQTKHSPTEFVALPSINEPQPAPLSLELAIYQWMSSAPVWGYFSRSANRHYTHIAQMTGYRKIVRKAP